LFKRLFFRSVYEIGAALFLCFFLPIVAFIVAVLSIAPVLSVKTASIPMDAVLKQFNRIRRAGRRHYAKRYSSPSSQQKLLQGKRPPVIYLRSFSAEMTDYDARFDLLTDDELICDVFSEFGPVIGIGRPGEKLPGLNFYSFYFEGEEWRENVIRLMDQAQMIVIKPGIAGQNLIWEIETAHKLKFHNKVIFPLIEYYGFSGAIRERQYDQFAKLLKDKMNVMVPQGIDTAILAYFDSPNRLVLAESDGFAKRFIIGLDSRLGESGVLRLHMRAALRQMLKRRGISLSKFATLRHMLFAFSYVILRLLFLLLTFLFIVWVVETYLRA
jgi:hypothetical protein